MAHLMSCHEIVMCVVCACSYQNYVFSCDNNTNPLLMSSTSCEYISVHDMTNVLCPRSHVCPMSQMALSLMSKNTFIRYIYNVNVCNGCVVSYVT